MAKLTAAEIVEMEKMGSDIKEFSNASNVAGQKSNKILL